MSKHDREPNAHQVEDEIRLRLADAVNEMLIEAYDTYLDGNLFFGEALGIVLGALKVAGHEAIVTRFQELIVKATERDKARKRATEDASFDELFDEIMAETPQKEGEK